MAAQAVDRRDPVRSHQKPVNEKIATYNYFFARRGRRTDRSAQRVTDRDDAQIGSDFHR
jgi:hypothetical protein